jgi:FkbM family methyltransferase
LGQATDEIVHGWMKLPALGTCQIKLADASIGKFEFDAHQSAYLAFASRFYSGGYEPAETMFLEAMLARSRCFYDVGSNWGYFSLLAATHPNFEEKIYSFDVSNEMNSALARIVQTLGLQTIEVMGCGLSDHSGSVQISDQRALHLTTVVSHAGGVVAQVTKLDDMDRPPPDLIKLDVEDHEFEVLDGGRRILREHRPVVLYETRVGDDGGKTSELLRNYGYRLYGINERFGTETGVELFPLNPDRDQRGGQQNLVAVPIGDEARWFDQQ